MVRSVGVGDDLQEVRLTYPHHAAEVLEHELRAMFGPSSQLQQIHWNRF
jgi:hypothetical protein